MAKTSKRRTQKRNQKRTQKRRQQRGGSSGWMRDPTFPTGLSAARYHPLQPQQSPAGQVGIDARMVGGRRSRRQRFTLRKQNGGGLLSTGGFADLGSAYGAGTGISGGVPSQGVQYATIPPITTTNTYQNGSPVSHQF